MLFPSESYYLLKLFQSESGRNDDDEEGEEEPAEKEVGHVGRVGLRLPVRGAARRKL